MISFLGHLSVSLGYCPHLPSLSPHFPLCAIPFFRLDILTQSVMLLLAAAFLVAFVLLLYMVSPLISPKPLKLAGAHIVVSLV